MMGAGRACPALTGGDTTLAGGSARPTDYASTSGVFSERSSIGTRSRLASPVYTWRGRAILRYGSSIISCHWASQPTVRGMPNSTVNWSGVNPMAW